MFTASEINAMSDADVAEEYFNKFGFPPITNVAMSSVAHILVPTFRKALIRGTALTEKEGEELDEKIYGKLEDNVD